MQESKSLKNLTRRLSGRKGEDFQGKNGAQGRIRTTDTRVFRILLQLFLIIISGLQEQKSGVLISV